MDSGGNANSERKAIGAADRDRSDFSAALFEFAPCGCVAYEKALIQACEGHRRY